MLGWENPINKILRKEPYSTSSKKYYIEQDDITAHWNSHSKHKTLDYNDFLKWKVLFMNWKLV